MNENVSTIEFVLEEAVRFRTMSRADFSKLSIQDVFSSIQLEKYGTVIIGRAAHFRLLSLAKKTLPKSAEAGRIDPSNMVEMMKAIIGQKFLTDLLPLDQKSADRTVSEAIRRCAQKKIDRTHFIPCSIGTGTTVDRIELGSVTFLRRSLIMSTYLDQPMTTNASTDHLLDTVRTYFSEFEWVSQVTIEQCDPEVSKKRAHETIQTAVDCLHLILGSRGSENLKVGGPALSAYNTAEFTTDTDGKLHPQMKRSWEQIPLGDGWWEKASSAVGGDATIQILGLAVSNRNLITKVPPVALRFFDALAWFREAIYDKYLPSRIIKFVTAMERLLITNKGGSITKALSERGGALLALGNFDEPKSCKKRISKIYQLRSELVHGSRSNSENELGDRVTEAETLSRYVLIYAAFFFRHNGFTALDVDNKRLSENYDRISREIYGEHVS